jgi:hypothetical protein
MEKFEQLTKVQQGLVNGLINEFTKINPKPSNGTTRFSFDTINECLKEEDRFKETIAKHNLTMMKVFVTQFKSDIKEFEKEFGKVVNVELGFKYPNSDKDHHTLDKMMEQTKEKPLENNYSYETELFFVSKTKNYISSDSRFDYFNNKLYHKVYVDFKREIVKVTLESGKVVQAYKIVGLTYNTNEWLHRDKENCKTFMTLDELIQSHKPTQQRLVELAQ